jgi:hypothetical protein
MAAAVRVISAIALAGAYDAVRFAAIHIGPPTWLSAERHLQGRRADVTG